MPTIVDSTHCHLWTDALHVRQLAREARNKWDRGTYVRLCVNTSWTALEVACQDALNCPDIGYRFKGNLDKALASASAPPIDWSCGVWQQVRKLQERRKSYVHRFASLDDMFPAASVADEAIQIVRDAIRSIHSQASLPIPSWAGLDEAGGWQTSSNFGTAWGTAYHSGTTSEELNTVRVSVVVGNEERLATVFPAGTNALPEVERILQSVIVPINAIRVYENGELTIDFIVNMRGNV